MSFCQAWRQTFTGGIRGFRWNLQISDTDETIQALLEREAEVAFVGRRVGNRQVVEEEELVLTVAPGDPFGSPSATGRSRPLQRLF